MTKAFPRGLKSPNLDSRRATASRAERARRRLARRSPRHQRRGRGRTGRLRRGHRSSRRRSARRGVAPHGAITRARAGAAPLSGRATRRGAFSNRSPLGFRPTRSRAVGPSGCSTPTRSPRAPRRSSRDASPRASAKRRRPLENIAELIESRTSPGRPGDYRRRRGRHRTARRRNRKKDSQGA